MHNTETLLTSIRCAERQLVDLTRSQTKISAINISHVMKWMRQKNVRVSVSRMQWHFRNHLCNRKQSLLLSIAFCKMTEWNGMRSNRRRPSGLYRRPSIPFVDFSIIINHYYHRRNYLRYLSKLFSIYPLSESIFSWLELTSAAAMINFSSFPFSQQ